MVTHGWHQASPYLYSFPFRLGVPEEDERTEALVRRLLDSHILSDCGPVFEAFDETLMFEELPGDSASAVLKSQFKGARLTASATPTLGRFDAHGWRWVFGGVPAMSRREGSMEDVARLRSVQPSFGVAEACVDLLTPHAHLRQACSTTSLP
jgi:hypothetical protein